MMREGDGPPSRKAAKRGAGRCIRGDSSRGPPHLLMTRRADVRPGWGILCRGSGRSLHAKRAALKLAGVSLTHVAGVIAWRGADP
jgi:hypothetical protein